MKSFWHRDIELVIATVETQLVSWVLADPSAKRFVVLEMCLKVPAAGSIGALAMVSLQSMPRYEQPLRDMEEYGGW